MVELPAVAPVVTSPDPSMLTNVLLLLQTPPPVPSFSVVPLLTHAWAVPPMPDGEVFTVTTPYAPHPPDIYVIIAVPVPTPVTTPVPDTTVAINVLLLLHIPPDVKSVNVVDNAWHTVSVPPTAEGD